METLPSEIVFFFFVTRNGGRLVDQFFNGRNSVSWRPVRLDEIRVNLSVFHQQRT